LEESDRFKVYSAMAEVSRKWVSVMDAKAGFLSTLNVATLVFIWTGAKFGVKDGCSYYIALGTTAMILLSLFVSLRVVLPRTCLWQAFGKPVQYVNGYQPISYFSYVAKNYPAEKQAEFFSLVDGMDEKSLTREALEQHYTICQVIEQKSSGVAWAGWLWMCAAALITVAFIFRG